MKSLFNMDDWILDNKIPVKNTLADISISLIYPDYQQFLQLKPKERVRKIDEYLKANLDKLISFKLFDNYTTIGTKRRPTSVKTKVMLHVLSKLSELDFINVRIDAIDGATPVEKNIAPVAGFFCVRMTIAIEIENLKTKKQDIEQRFVMLKAESFEDAYAKIERNKDDYATPYLNPDGRLVRWRVESFDDCFDIGTIELADFNNPEGIEVYSKLKTRKRKSYWDGK
ncbi:MAG: DUF4288 domain-containing protein [Mucilaginibacter sp.]|jgi:hypothetical protein|uniref:DUF4288 domain-containing protein n=1 Tax=Mucilaginibacter sp. TaxID=1882438 RepID=UPI00356B5BDF